jgi:hypothetical protein
LPRDFATEKKVGARFYPLPLAPDAVRERELAVVDMTKRYGFVS